MPVERNADHPTFEAGGNTITSFAAPARGSAETILFKADIPPGGGLPRHKHDHFDVFTVSDGSGTMHIGQESWEVFAGDSVVVPIGEWHFIEAGSQGVGIIVTMVSGTLMIREDGTESVPPWGE
ncbi:MAG: cupin domain-containing protein [Actinomycetota bacterium]